MLFCETEGSVKDMVSFLEREGEGETSFKDGMELFLFPMEDSFNEWSIVLFEEESFEVASECFVLAGEAGSVSAAASTRLNVADARDLRSRRVQSRTKAQISASDAVDAALDSGEASGLRSGEASGAFVS